MTDNNNNDEISLKELILSIKEYWLYLLPKWKIILIVGILGGALGIGYSIIRKPTYKAVLSFALEEASSGGGMSSLASLAGFDLGGEGGGAFSGDNLLELLKARSMAEKTLLGPIKTPDGRIVSMADYFMEFSETKKDWDEELLEKKPELKSVKYPLNEDRANFTRAQDSVLGNIVENIKKNNIKIEKIDKKLSIINVTCTSTDELFSKYYAEGLVKNVGDVYVQTKTARTLKNVQSLEIKADSLRIAMDKAILAKAKVSDGNMNANPARQIGNVEEIGKEVELKVVTLTYSEVIKNLEISKMALLRETPLLQVIDSPIFPLEVSRVGKLKGLVIGGFIAGFLIVAFLLGRKIINDSMNE